MRLMTIVGARPQFVKAAPVSRALRARTDVEEVLIHTGQHFDHSMSQAFFDELGIDPPAVNLGVHGGGLVDMTARMLGLVGQQLTEIRPDALLVYGDTTSTLAGALAAFHDEVPVIHVESGLRSFDRTMPEERNRVLTDHASTLLLCPTAHSVANLEAEGITAGVHHVGDVMYDAFLQHASTTRPEALTDLGLEPGRYVLATVHRQSSTDSREALQAVIAHLLAVNRQFRVVLPLHPRTRAAATSFDIDLSALHVIDPVDYGTFAALLAHAAEVHTDSGGVQKEAYFHRVPCVTLRSETEWVETIEAGWNRLWTQDPAVRPTRREIADYGDGDAAATIADVITQHFAIV